MRGSTSHSRLLLVFLAGSVAAHAAVFGVLPGYARDAAPAAVTLEVMMEQPVPLPLAPAEPLPQRKPEAPRIASQAPAIPQPAPVLALPAPQAPAANAFTVPAPEVSELSPAPEQKQQVASIAATPPAYGAAYLRNPAPPYPAAARRNGVQGTVMLKVVVARDGLPARVELEKSSGSMHLDSAALEAVKAWRFVPARRGNEPVEGIVTFPIVFRLENAS